MSNSELEKAAIKYVEETDYIDNNNRRLAGNAFLAGAAWQRGQQSVETRADGNLREIVEQAITAYDRGRDMGGPIHRLRLAIDWPIKGVPERAEAKAIDETFKELEAMPREEFRKAVESKDDPIHRAEGYCAPCDGRCYVESECSEAKGWCYRPECPDCQRAVMEFGASAAGKCKACMLASKDDPHA